MLNHEAHFYFEGNTFKFFMIIFLKIAQRNLIYIEMDF